MQKGSNDADNAIVGHGSSKKKVICDGLNLIMSKSELIRQICTLDKLANPAFLANLSTAELNDYLKHLLSRNLEPVLAGAKT